MKRANCFYRACLGCFCVALLLLAMGGVAVCQGLPSPVDRNQGRDRLQDTLRNIERERSLRERKIQEESIERIDVFPEEETEEQEKDASPSEQPCFEINSIEIEGYAPLESPPEGYADLVDDCVNVEKIKSHLQRLNNDYKKKGYITTRVYVPEQNLSQGTLKLIVIPGKLERFEYTDGREIDTRIITAFPFSAGDVLNLRSLEQGFENFNSVASQKVSFKLFPGSSPGYSVVRIELEEGLPWHVDATLDNSGFPTTGRAKTTFATTFDNPLIINDRLTVNLGGASFNDRTQKFSDSFDVSYSFPFKNFYFFSNVGHSRYKVTVNGVNQDFILDGRSRYFSLGTEYMLYRNQRSKYYFYSTLKLNRATSYFDNFEIIGQRRQLTILRFGLRGRNYVKRATLDWNFGMKRGLDMLGAEDIRPNLIDPLITTAEPFFWAFEGNFAYETPILASSFNYRLRGAFQVSNDHLPGTEQFFFGSRDTVRGYHEDNLYGNSGMYFQNTIGRQLVNRHGLKLEGYVGFDGGLIKRPPTRNFEDNYLLGSVVGLRLSQDKGININVAWSRGFNDPDDFFADQDQYYLTFSWSI